MWFRKKQKPEPTPEEQKQVKVPKGLWIKCEGCSQIIYREAVERNLNVCPKCNFHFTIQARERLKILCDDGNYEELFSNLESEDPLSFNDQKSYRDRLNDYKKRTGEKEAIIVVKTKIGGIEVILCVMEYFFMGGSMGSVVGEKIKRAIFECINNKYPLIIISASGGARMQESVFSLMQMAKVSSALAELHKHKIPYISVLTNPTTGGVTASYAMLGDVNIAEPKALIGFAGPRVIEQTIKQKLPENFQRSEFLLEKGMLDLVVERAKLKETLQLLLKFFTSNLK